MEYDSQCFRPPGQAFGLQSLESGPTPDVVSSPSSCQQPVPRTPDPLTPPSQLSGTQYYLSGTDSLDDTDLLTNLDLLDTGSIYGDQYTHIMSPMSADVHTHSFRPGGEDAASKAPREGKVSPTRPSSTAPQVLALEHKAVLSRLSNKKRSRCVG